jgi:hypothetical protein
MGAEASDGGDGGDGGDAGPQEPTTLVPPADTPGPPRPPGPDAGRAEQPWAPTFNTGVPASLPATPPGWNVDYPDQPGPGIEYPPVRSRSPGYWGFAPADPAAVSGPPWPPLIAPPGYTPPRLISWPIFVGLGAAVAAVVLAVALPFVVFSSGLTNRLSHASWLAAHESTIKQLNEDQLAITSEKSNPSAALADWQRFHADTEAAASLPNPGGAATVPWREMLQDYITGSGEVIQAAQTQNRAELNQAQAILGAGDAAARQFNRAMGITSP